MTLSDKITWSNIEFLRDALVQDWETIERRLRTSGALLAMAASPAYAATINMGAVAVSATADTSYTAPSNAVTALTAGASGSKVDEVDFEGTGTTVAGTITVFLYDGSTYRLFDVVAVPAVTASTTVAPWRTSRTYSNLTLKNGWSLRFASTVASQLVSVSAFGADI